MLETASAFEDANAALHRNDWPQAERLYHVVCRADPAHAAARFGLGLTQNLLGKHGTAIGHLKIAICLSPSAERFQDCLARMLSMRGLEAEAARSFIRRSRLAPTADHFVLAAEAFIRAGALVEALDACDAALRLDPGHPTARGKLRTISAQIEATEKSFTNYVNFLGTETRFPVPYSMFAGRPHEPNGSGLLDAMGFRNDPPPAPRKDPDEIRVFVLGDSSIFNGPDDSDTVPGHLQTLLGDRPPDGRRFSVYNFGVVSSCFPQMIALLTFRLSDLNPDIVLVHTSAIDMFAPLTFDPRPGNPYNFYAVEELYTRCFDSGRVAREGFIIRASDVVRSIIVRQAHLRATVGWKTDAWERELVARFVGHARRLERLSAGFGVKTALLLQPLVMFKKRLSADEAVIEIKDDFRDYMFRQYERLRDDLFRDGGAARSPSFWIQDNTRLFDDTDAAVFDDFIHYNQNGRRLVAESMKETVLGMM